MDFDVLLNFATSLPHVTEHFPFDDTTLVLKIGGKMFALIDIESPESINLKCNPDRALALRDAFEEIIPGYHMNKKHWNTVGIKGSLKDALIKELILHSYELVKAQLPKRILENLQ
jgi:predicted DNA-binding protein (MmcQ/YjbR family)